MEQIGRTKVTFTRGLIVWMSEKRESRIERAPLGYSTIESSRELSIKEKKEMGIQRSAKGCHIYYAANHYKIVYKCIRNMGG